MKRDAALEANDHTQLKVARTRIRRLKRKIRALAPVVLPHPVEHVGGFAVRQFFEAQRKL